MKIRAILFVILFVLALFFIGITLPAGDANAAPDAQFVTATPGPDDRIIYIVAEGDSCSSIALLHGISVEQLRQLNSRLDENCTVTIGQQMVVGLAPADAPTAGPRLHFRLSPPQRLPSAAQLKSAFCSSTI